VRLTTSLQVGAKYLGCVVYRFHVASDAGSAPASPRGSYMSFGGRLLQRAEEDAMRTTTGLSRRQVGATRRAGTFSAFPAHLFPPDSPSAPGGPGWPGLIGWIKAQIRTKTRRLRDLTIFYRPDEKKKATRGLVEFIIEDALKRHG
jgi:hypothetical protein